MSSTEEATAKLSSFHLQESPDHDSLDDDLRLIFDSGDESPAAGARRSGQVTLTQLQEIYDILDKGHLKAAERITLKRIIDFPYNDACTDGCKSGCSKHLNLQNSGNSLLERAWIFQVDDAERRWVVHGHTFLKWVDRAQKNVQDRADELTSLNIRTADRHSAGWRSDPYGEVVIPQDRSLKHGWNKPRDTYNRMQVLLKIAQEFSLQAESFSKSQTHQLFRSHVRVGEDGDGSQMDNGDPVDEFDVFVPRRPVREYEQATPSPRTDPQGWGGLRVAALCIGCSSYKYMARLPNAVRDAQALCDTVGLLPHCQAKPLLNVKDTKDLRSGIIDFLEHLQDIPPTVVVISYSGHGGVLKKSGKECLMPCEVDPNDKRNEETDFGLSSNRLLSLCVEYLDLPALKRGKIVNFLIFFDCCRVSIMGSSSHSPHPASLQGSDDESPRIYKIYYSCRPDTEASDGRAGGNSPFVQALLDKENGIFVQGTSIAQGLKVVEKAMTDKTRQQLIQAGTGSFGDELCIHEGSSSDNGRDTPSSNSAPREEPSDYSGAVGHLCMDWKSYKDGDKNDLVSGRQNFRGESVHFSKERDIVPTRRPEESPFCHDTRVSKKQMTFVCKSKNYHLKNLEPSCGTWLRVDKALPLLEGTIFKVGIDQVGPNMLPGLDIKNLYKSCFKVTSADVNSLKLEREPITKDREEKRAKIPTIRKTTIYHRTDSNEAEIKRKAGCEDAEVRKISEKAKDDTSSVCKIVKDGGGSWLLEPIHGEIYLRLPPESEGAETLMLEAGMKIRFGEVSFVEIVSQGTMDDYSTTSRMEYVDSSCVD